MIRRAAFCLSVLVVTGCGAGGQGTLDDLRGEILAHLTDDVVLPRLREADAAGRALADAAAALEAAPDPATLAACQAAWRSGRAAWNRAEAVVIGPPDDLLLSAKIDTSPVDEPRIEEAIALAPVLDASFVESLGSTRKGYHALEYLLFHPTGDPAPVLALLTGGVPGERRRTFLAAVAENLAGVLAQVRHLWEPAGGGFATQFRLAGAGSTVFATRQQAIDLLLNHLIAFTETLADQRLGRPLGRTAGGVPQPPGAECARSGNSLADALNDALGLRDVYTGTPDGSPGSGLMAYVRATHTEIEADLTASFAAAVDTIAAIPETLLGTAATEPETVEAAFAAARALKARIVADLTAVYGGTLTFSPFDGD